MAWMGHPSEGPMPGMATPEEIDRLSTLPPDTEEGSLDNGKRSHLVLSG